MSRKRAKAPTFCESFIVLRAGRRQREVELVSQRKCRAACELRRRSAILCNDDFKK
jgi:hypothetical protein